MSTNPRRSIVQTAAELGRLARAADAAGNHHEAAKLYREALLLLQQQPHAEDMTARGLANIFATAPQTDHIRMTDSGGGDTPRR